MARDQDCRLIPGKWYVSKAFKCGRGPGIDRSDINDGVHRTVVHGPLDTKEEADSWANAHRRDCPPLYVWQWHDETSRSPSKP